MTASSNQTGPRPARWLRWAGFVAAAIVVAVFGAAGTARAVVGGRPADEGAYAFVAKIDAGERTCTGALVHAQWVLTVKRCFGDVPALAGPPPTATTVTVGRADLTRNTGSQVAATMIFPHPTLNVALATLATPVADIPPVSIGDAPASGEVLRAAGYGRTATEWVPDRLHTAQVRVGTVDEAGYALSAAGSDPVTTCQGDAGGPTLREAGGQVQLVGLHEGSRQGGCLDERATGQGATDIRADKLREWIRQHLTIPHPVDEMSRNLARDAKFTASSSAENWGWFLVDVNDGVREVSGWSSWSQHDVDHTEWLEFAFANGETRRLNRVDLYPRVDLPGGNFPRNFTIDVWTGNAWETVVSKTNYTASGLGQRFSFPAKSTTKVRVQGTGLRLMQFNEVEAYLSTNLAADATFRASSSAENWGWFLADVNDGVREVSGWSSWSQHDVDHTEWLEFTFPDGAVRELNRIDLYPRMDLPGGNFPRNFTIDLWIGDRWVTVVSKTNYTASGLGQRFRFPARSTSRVRVQGTGLRLMQFNEVEAYLSTNLAADATFRASSSAENWGWFLADINDGMRDTSGWSSWSQHDVDHTEWLEFTFPDGAVRELNRIDLYPRVDLPGGNFPRSFTIDVWTGDAWETVVSRTSYEANGQAQRFAFAARSTNKVRIQGTGLRLMQFNEVEAYHLHPSPTIPAPGDPLPSIVEERDYPGAAAVLAQRGIKLFKGDGHIVLVDCGPNPNSPPRDVILVQSYDLNLPGDPNFCFKAKGTSGYLTMELRLAYTIRGENSRTIAARVEVADDPTVVEVERVDPGEWQPVGIGQSRGDATILELRFPYVR